jgi:hypothetical protein
MEIAMERQILERWLPSISLVLGLLLLAAAAFGQESPPSEPGAPTSVTSPDPGSDAPARHRMGDWRRRMMERFSRMTPEKACKERYAREAGFLAYLGAELDLTAQQQPLWDAYQRAMLDAAGKQRQACVENVVTPGSDLTALQRRDRLQKLLQTRLDGLQATRPPLEALYQSLSREQRRTLDRPFGEWTPSRR